MSKTQKLICHPQLGQMSGESVLKCSFSVNLAGRRSVIACEGTQLEIRSELLYEYCCSSFLLDVYAMHPKGGLLFHVNRNSIYLQRVQQLRIVKNF